MNTTSPCKRKLTTVQYAREIGVSPNKVLAWITSGQLRAMNAATRPNGRPRYLIDRDDIESFERSRAITPPAPRQRRRPRKQSDVINFIQ